MFLHLAENFSAAADGMCSPGETKKLLRNNIAYERIASEVNIKQDNF